MTGTQPKLVTIYSRRGLALMTLTLAFSAYKLLPDSTPELRNFIALRLLFVSLLPYVINV